MEFDFEQGATVMGQTQKVEVTRACDTCSKSVVLIQGELSHEDLTASAGWYVVVKEHLLEGDQLAPISKLACSKPCAIALLNSDALELPGSVPAHGNVLDFKKVAN
jgi:hypothetical protein